MASEDTRSARKNPAEKIETVTVDVDEILEGLKFNNQPPEYTNQKTAVLRIQPPFDTDVEASIHYSESGTRYPPEMDQKPLHISPISFVKGRDETIPPNRNDQIALAKEELDDPSDEEITEWVDEAFDVWEEFVRANLENEIDLSESVQYIDSSIIVDVEYESD